jgi:hypothetical protein
VAYKRVRAGRFGTREDPGSGGPRAARSDEDVGFGARLPTRNPTISGRAEGRSVRRSPQRRHLVQHDSVGVRQRQRRRPGLLPVRSSPSRWRGSVPAAAGWLLLKESAVYGDNPRHAFSVPPPETVRRPNPADRDGAFAVWESTIKPALAIVGAAAVVRKMKLAARTARAWTAGERRPESRAKLRGRSLLSHARPGSASLQTSIFGQRRCAANCRAARSRLNTSSPSWPRCSRSGAAAPVRSPA